MDVEHSFDIKGLLFSGKILLSLLFAGTALYFGFSYTTKTPPTQAAAPVIVAVQDTQQEELGSTEITLSAATPERIISKLSIEDAVSKSGKFAAADLANMKMILYQDGVALTEYPILTKGKPGSFYETPSGFYTVLSKEVDHLNKTEQIHLPYSMQFYGNYFIHGWPYYEDGSPVNPAYSGGCIRLSTADAKKVYAFIDKGTGLFVYDPKHTTPPPSLVLNTLPTPSVSAVAYLVADIDTGDVFLEQSATDPRPIASVTKLMTALVANETIMFYKKVPVARSELLHDQDPPSDMRELFAVGDLLYPLLMESNNAVADRIAKYYGTPGFVDWMNTTAKSLDMQSTHFTDPSGISSKNVSTPDDLFRLAAYLANKKSFVFDITRTPLKKLTAESGNVYKVNNFNVFSSSANFIGGKVGQTSAAGETMISLFSVPVHDENRRVAIVVLKSDDYTADTTNLINWFTKSAQQESVFGRAACASCAKITQYRKIQ